MLFLALRIVANENLSRVELINAWVSRKPCCREVEIQVPREVVKQLGHHVGASRSLLVTKLRSAPSGIGL